MHTNDNGLEKMNPLTVIICDINSRIASSQLLDMCLTCGPNGGKVETSLGHKKKIIGLYREYAIAIQDEVGDSNGGNV